MIEIEKNLEKSRLKILVTALLARKPTLVEVISSPLLWWAIWFSLFLPWRLNIPSIGRYELDLFRQHATHLLPALLLFLQIFSVKKLWVKIVSGGLCLPVLIVGLFLLLCNGFTPYVVNNQSHVGTHILEHRSHWVFYQSPNTKLWQIIPIVPGLEFYRELGFGNSRDVNYKIIDDNTIELRDGMGIKKRIRL